MQQKQYSEFNAHVLDTINSMLGFLCQSTNFNKTSSKYFFLVNKTPCVPWKYYWDQLLICSQASDYGRFVYILFMQSLVRSELNMRKEKIIQMLEWAWQSCHMNLLASTLLFEVVDPQSGAEHKLHHNWWYQQVELSAENSREYLPLKACFV